MATISNLEVGVLDRLEEDRVTPKFWSVQDEIRPYLVEAMMEATLISGEPEIRRSTLFTIAADTTIHSVPSEAVALLRVQGHVAIPKTTLWELDEMIDGWRSDTADVNNDVLQYWFPIGLTRFGIYPKLNAVSNVTLHYIGLPVTAARPYAGTESVPFQDEYDDAFTDYAAHVSRLKEGGNDFVGSIRALDRFNEKMIELSKFAYRKHALRFTRTMGAASVTTEVEEK